MKDCGTCYYRNSTWSLQNREMSASCEHGNAPSDALLKLRIGAGSVVSAPVWCPLEEQKPMTCNHQWSAEPHEGLGSHYCHNCNEWEIEVNYDRALNAIENVAMLAKRLRKTDPVNAEHFLRFCREAGWEDSVLRDVLDRVEDQL